jgi:hypothetical protein
MRHVSTHFQLLDHTLNCVNRFLCAALLAVRAEHGGQSALYRMLRQALLSRRALLLLDGLDEGGVKRNEIERHVVEVLAPQVRPSMPPRLTSSSRAQAALWRAT